MAFSGADQVSMVVEGLVSSTLRFSGGESGSEDGMDEKHLRVNGYGLNLIYEFNFTVNNPVIKQF